MLWGWGWGWMNCVCTCWNQTFTIISGHTSEIWKFSVLEKNNLLKSGSSINETIFPFPKNLPKRLVQMLSYLLKQTVTPRKTRQSTVLTFLDVKMRREKWHMPFLKNPVIFSGFGYKLGSPKVVGLYALCHSYEIFFGVCYNTETNDWLVVEKPTHLKKRCASQIGHLRVKIIKLFKKPPPGWVWVGQLNQNFPLKNPFAHQFPFNFQSPLEAETPDCERVGLCCSIVAALSVLPYCWWTNSCTTWYGRYPVIYKVYISQVVQDLFHQQ